MLRRCAQRVGGSGVVVGACAVGVFVATVGLVMLGSPAASACAADFNQTVTLAPATQSLTVGATATVTASVTDNCGSPVGQTANFMVVSGPNAGMTGSGVIDSNGQASFSYNSSAVGTDTIEAMYTDSATTTSNQVSVVWTPGQNDNSQGDDNNQGQNDE